MHLNSNKLEQLERLRSEITPATPWLPILVIHIRSKIKTRQSQSYKLKKNAKNSNFEILQKALHATHLLKLLDKMYKYEMDPTTTVGATERTRNAGRMDGWTDGQTDGQTEGRNETSIPPTTSLYNNIWKLIPPHGKFIWCLINTSRVKIHNASGLRIEQPCL